MMALFGGIAHAPLAVMIMVAEMTGNLALLAPAMVARGLLVESALLAHPEVAECAVVGANDSERGQVVAAFVVLKAGVEADNLRIKILQDHVKATIAPYKYPRLVKFVDALPKTQTGKIQRFKLRDQVS